MRIDNAGRVGIGGTSTGGSYGNVANQLPLTGAVATSAYGAIVTIQSGVTSFASIYKSQPTTAAATFTLASLAHFSAEQYGFGAGSTVTNQYGFFADSGLTTATNNYGFYSSIASGSGRYNFYAAGTADNFFAGAVGVGATPNVGETLNISKNPTGAATAYGLRNYGTIQSDVNFAYYGALSAPATAAASFTLTSLIHFSAKPGTFGAGSTVTNQYGFLADASITGATNNYGFFSNIASGSGRYNFYAAGTADNYFAGNVGVGQTTPTVALDIGSVMSASQIKIKPSNGNVDLRLNAAFGNADVASLTVVTAYPLAFHTNNSERMRITSSGDVGIGTSSPAYKLEVNGSFAAITKSFVIDHPTKPDKKLRYGSLEGPENGVYIRGKGNSEIIELPDYWVGLVYEDSITVNLTAIGDSDTPRVKDIIDNKIIVFSKEGENLNYFYTVFAERKDVEKLIVEY
jgi:hypothetical protein